jgi:hypothetical protein
MNKYFALAALIFTVSPAYAGDVGEFQAATINLEPFQGIIYYTNESDGYHVVATVAEGETGLPVRFEATLAEAQKLTISVPGRMGEKSRSFEISRVGEKLTVLEPQLMIEDAVAGAQALAR